MWSMVMMAAVLVFRDSWCRRDGDCSVGPQLSFLERSVWAIPASDDGCEDFLPRDFSCDRHPENRRTLWYAFPQKTAVASICSRCVVVSCPGSRCSVWLLLLLLLLPTTTAALPPAWLPLTTTAAAAAVPPASSCRWCCSPFRPFSHPRRRTDCATSRTQAPPAPEREHQTTVTTPRPRPSCA